MARGSQSGSKNQLENWLEVQHLALAKMGHGHVFKVPTPVVVERVTRGKVAGRLESPVATDFAGTVRYGRVNLADGGAEVFEAVGRSVIGEAKGSSGKSGIALSMKHLRPHQRRFLQHHAELGAIVWIHFQRRNKEALHPDNYCVPVTAAGPACFDWEVTYLSWKALEPWRLPVGRSWVDCAVGLEQTPGMFWELYCKVGWGGVEAAQRGALTYG